MGGPNLYKYTHTRARTHTHTCTLARTRPHSSATRPRSCRWTPPSGPSPCACCTSTRWCPHARARTRTHTYAHKRSHACAPTHLRHVLIAVDGHHRPVRLLALVTHPQGGAQEARPAYAGAGCRCASNEQGAAQAVCIEQGAAGVCPLREGAYMAGLLCLPVV